MSFSLMSCSSYGDKLSNYRVPKPIQLPYKSTVWQFIEIMKLLLWDSNSKLEREKFPNGKKYKGYFEYRESSVSCFIN